MVAAEAAHRLGEKSSQLESRIITRYPWTWSNIHAEVCWGTAESRAKVQDGCDKRYVSVSTKPKHMGMIIVVKLHTEQMPKHVLICISIKWGAHAINCNNRSAA